MNLSAQFKEYLISQSNPPSLVTVKNYISDINKFIRWIEAKLGYEFNPSDVNQNLLDKFKEESLSTYSASSVERSLSSLRKFFYFLKLEGKISQTPFEVSTVKTEAPDPWKIKEFKNHLYVFGASHLTIKNYVIDVKQFLTWADEVVKTDETWEITNASNFGKITSGLIEEYKTRLLNEARLSPVSVNRKLSSIRRFISWANEEGLIKDQAEVINLQPNDFGFKTHSSAVLATTAVATEALSEIGKAQAYSAFPPLRVAQKTKDGAIAAFDTALTAPLADALEKSDEVIWNLKGRPVFKDKIKASFRIPSFKMIDPKKINNVPKSFYAPALISTASFPLHRKALHHARHSRPKWYKAYHSYAFVSYLHFSILMLFISAMGYMVFNDFNAKKQTPIFAALPSAPPRILSFQGRLTDANDNPITKGTTLRMAIYNNQSATGSALLWQEIVSPTPDEEGIFSILLGNNNPIPQSLFAQNSGLWLGVTVERTEELKPRQQIATVAFAANAETLQGLPPITNTTATSNVVLALNSSGNLTIGGTANPIFQATGGTFTVSGRTLVLTTSNNGNIRLAPNGSGIIDIQKPLQNTTNSNALVPGSVTIEDIFSVVATSSGQAVLNLSQGSTGDLILASVSGSTKFRIDNGGNLIAAGSLNGLGVSSGTVTSGTWQGTAIAAPYGGTGQTSYSTGDMLYASDSTVISKLSIGSNGTCLTSNGTTPSWVSCVTASGSSGYWNQSAGVLFPNNTTVDFLIGSQSSDSADFAVLNINGTGPAIASVSGNLIVMPTNGAGGRIGIGTTNPDKSLTVFDQTNELMTTGTQIHLVSKVNSSNNGFSETFLGLNNPLNPIATQDIYSFGAEGTLSASGAPTNYDFYIFDVVQGKYRLYVGSSGSIGLGTNLPTSQLHVTRALTNGATGKALAIFDQIENQDIFTASKSGVPMFTVNLNGNLQFKGGTSFLTTLTSLNDSDLTLTIPNSSASTDTFCLATLGNCNGQGITNYWQLNSGLISPFSNTADFAIGGTSTSSADFAVLNINGSGPAIASVSGNLIVMSTNGAGGNIGIGTTNPVDLLHLSSGATGQTALRLTNAATGYTSADGLQIGQNENSGIAYVWNYENSALSLGTNDLDRIFITGSGNVGINSFGNLGTLDVRAISSVLPIASISGSTSGPALALDQTGDGEIFSASKNGQARFTIWNSGDTGIFSDSTGYSGPTNGGMAGLSIYDYNSAVDSQNGIQFYSSDSTGNGRHGAAIAFGKESTWTGGSGIYPGYLSFWTRPNINTGFELERLRVTASGLLNIGTSTGNSQLYVTRPLSFGVTGKALAIFDQIENQDIFTASASGATKFVIKNDGNVGIGTTNPLSQLTVGEIGNGPFNLLPTGGFSLAVRSKGDTLTTNGMILTASDYESYGGALYFNVPSAFSGTTYKGQIQASGYSGTFDLVLQPNGSNVGIGTNTTTAKLDVAGTASIGGQLSFRSGTAQIQSTQNQNITIGGNTTGNIILSPLNGSGSLQFTNLTTNGGVLFTNGSGVLAQTPAGSLGECFISGGGGAPSWGSCGSSAAASYWKLNSGAISPINSTLDLLIGGTATASSKFAFINVNSGTPTLKIFNSTSANSLNLYHDGTDAHLEASSGQVVIGSGTGNVVIEDSLVNDTANNSGFLKIADKLLVQNTESSALVVFDNLGSGDIFTGSASGTTRFVINNSGDISAFGGDITNGTANLDIGEALSGDISITGDFVPSADNSYTLGSSSSSWNTLYIKGPFNLNGSNGSAGECLKSGGSGAATWGSCGSSSGSSNWTLNTTTGVLRPNNNTADILFGGVATASSKFAFLNVAGGTPIASISANSGSGATYLSGTGQLGTTSRQALFLGNSTVNSTTGDVFINSDSSSGLRVGIGTTNTTSTNSLAVGGNSGDLIRLIGGTGAINESAFVTFQSRGRFGYDGSVSGGAVVLSDANASKPIIFMAGGPSVEKMRIGANLTSASASVSGSTSFAGLVVDNSFASGDIFTASKSGKTHFVIDRNGNVGIGNSMPRSRLEVGANLGTGIDEVITVRSQGRAGLHLFSDTSDNGAEPGGAYVLFNDDGATTTGGAIIGTIQAANTDPSGIAFSNLDTNSFLIGLREAQDIQFGTNSTASMILSATNLLGLGTTAPTSQLYVTRPLTFGATGKALAIFDQIENQDILTASASGTSVFTVARTGGLTISGSPTTALNISNTGVTTDINFQNGETLDNNTNGLIQLTGAVGSNFNLNGSTTTFPASEGFTMGWNHTAGQGEVDLIVRQGAGATGGFRIYDWDGATATQLFDLRANGDLFLDGAVDIDEAGTALDVNDTAGASSSFIARSGGTIAFQIGSAREMLFTLRGGAGDTTIGTCKLNADSAGAQDDQELRDCSGTPSDIAEFYPSEGGLKPGDLVYIDSNSGTPIVRKTENPYDPRVIGVVSTFPVGQFGKPLGTELFSPDKNPAAIGLSGRVPVKVTNQNGNIKAGDPLAASEIPGVVMKATKQGRVVGFALEDYDGSIKVSAGTRLQEEERNKQVVKWNDDPEDPEDGIGKILLMTNLVWYDPDVQLADSGYLTLTPTIDDNFEVKRQSGETVQRIGAFSEIITAKIKSGYFETGKLLVTGSASVKNLTTETLASTIGNFSQLSTDSIVIGSENITIAGQSLREYIASIVEDVVGAQEEDTIIVAPILATDIITPKTGKNLTIKLGSDDSSSTFQIQNLSGTTVAAIDALGNASLSGELKSDSIVTNDASISGTLRATKIIADQIEGLNIQASSVSANYITNNYYQEATPSGQTYQATGSASFDNLVAMRATFEQGLMAFGPASFYEASVADRLFVGSKLSLADTSINVLGGNLELQPLRQGGVSLVGGQVEIDVDGNLRVDGNAYFAKDVDIKGKLLASFVSPLPGRDFVLELGKRDGDSESENHNSSFIIRNSSASALLSVNNQGDLNASGAGTFNKLNLNIVNKALAISPTEVIATGSAGTAEIQPNREELTVRNALVTEDSLIYITTKTSTQSESVYLLRQVPNKSFTVGISNPINKKVPFNWIIIN